MADTIPTEVDKLLDPTMKKVPFDTVKVGKATYHFIDQYDDTGGEPVIVRTAPGEEPKVVEDILPSDNTSGGAGGSGFPAKLQERLKAIRGDQQAGPAGGATGGGALLTQTELDKRLFQQAKKCATVGDPDHLSSANAPGTDHGNLACAWAVNQVTKMALGREIGGGLSTASMFPVLKAKHKPLDRPVPGCVIISPTVTSATTGRRNIGHVGIVGEVNDQDDEKTKIYSNSSGHKQFEQNKTLENWNAHYKREKGLAVKFFELDPRQFPGAGA